MILSARDGQSTSFAKEHAMKALVYNGPYDVQVKNMPDAKIEKPTDVLVRITTTNICGSDLHMYEGRTDMESGRILGHENLGEVIAVGNAVDRVKVGDMVKGGSSAIGRVRSHEAEQEAA